MSQIQEESEPAKRLKLDRDPVENFISYLRIRTVQPTPEYDAARTYLEGQAAELGLPCKVFELVPGRPIVIITWEGIDPSLKSVVLNSHIDVVPVYPEYWKYDPFSGHKEENGDIYARGSQDMKCVGIQYIEAIQRLKAQNKRFLRTFHMTFVPDEEIGGADGMKLFVKHEEFKKLNVGFALDEGLANPTEAFTVYYGERCPWWVEVTCPGNPGHGSRFIEGDAGTKIRRVINSFMNFRDQEEAKLQNDPKLRLGDVTTTNFTMMSGGVQPNVVPAELKAVFDMRVAPTVDMPALEAQIHQWCKQAGEGVSWKFLQKNTCQTLTSTSKDDPWWAAFSGAYTARTYLEGQAEDLGLPCKVLEIVPGRPIVIITWEGTDPSLKSVVLNSHIDVVPVYPESWKYDPFSAHKDENGDIYARGTQDMKCVGIQYIEALKRLKAQNKQFLRTFHMTFVPDEEIVGIGGMQSFVKHEVFKDLNVGLALDEGQANPTEAFTVYYGERCTWWIEVTCRGNPGHASRFIEGDAGTKMRKIINSFMKFRDQEEAKLQSDPKLRLGDVTTTNFTVMSGGVQPNVVPAELKAVFDMRVAPTVVMPALEEQINQWCKQAGEGVSWKFLDRNTCQTVTSTSKDDPWWAAFSGACEKMNLTLELEIFPAGTDSRFIRKVGLPALGFSPMNKTPILLHDHNEFLNEEIFLRGIDIYMEILSALGNVAVQL